MTKPILSPELGRIRCRWTTSRIKLVDSSSLKEMNSIDNWIRLTYKRPMWINRLGNQPQVVMNGRDIFRNHRWSWIMKSNTWKRKSEKTKQICLSKSVNRLVNYRLTKERENSGKWINKRVSSMVNWNKLPNNVIRQTKSFNLS